MATFSDLVTFTRSGTALYRDNTGTWQTSADGEPRIGHHVYENGAWVNKGLLIESEESTNYITQNDMTDGAAVGVLGAGGALPTGWEHAFAGGAGGTFEVVAVGSDYGTPELSGTQRDSGGSPLASLDFLDSVPITGTLARYGGTASITEPMATQMSPDFRVISTGAWDATFRISLPQLEEGKLASSPIETSGSAATRSGEGALVPNAKLPDLSGGVTFILEGALDYADTDLFNEGVLLEFFADVDNYIRFRLDTQGTNTGNFAWQLKNSGTLYTTQTPDDLFTPDLDIPFKIAATVSNSEIGMTVNGTSYTPVSVPSLPDFNGVDMKIGELFQGTFSLVRVFDTVLSEADREAETS